MGVGKNALNSKKNAVLRDVVSRKHCMHLNITRNHEKQTGMTDRKNLTPYLPQALLWRLFKDVVGSKKTPSNWPGLRTKYMYIDNISHEHIFTYCTCTNSSINLQL